MKKLLGICLSFVMIFTLAACSTQKNDTSKKEDTKEETKTKKALFTYTSGDKNAAQGDPEELVIYSVDDSSFDFKFHATWLDKDLTGKAKKMADNANVKDKKYDKLEKYSYSYNNGKNVIYFIMETDGEDSVTFVEEENNEDISVGTLYK